MIEDLKRDPDAVWKFANFFRTGQYGRFYTVRSSDARGRRFRIYVLPEGEAAVPNGEPNPPLNDDAVCVYDGERGWLHEGKWQDDFFALGLEKKAESDAKKAEQERREAEAAKAEEERVAKLLAAY